MNRAIPGSYEYHSYIRGTECDYRDHIYPHELLSVAQEAADGHVRRFGMGTDELAKQECCWIVSSISGFFAAELPGWRDEISATTWCPGIRGIHFLREHIFERSDDHAPFAYLASDWSVLKTEDRRPVRPFEIMEKLEVAEDFITDFSICQQRSQRLRRLSPDELQRGVRTQHTVRYSELDHNAHFNNVRYLSSCLDAVAHYLQNQGETLADLSLRRLDINYAAELFHQESFELCLLEESALASECLSDFPFPCREEKLRIFRLDGLKADGSCSFRTRLIYQSPAEADS